MKTLSFGEVLFDRIEGKDHFGGAPVNVAVHLSRQGADSFMLSALGNDSPGKEALKIMEGENLLCDYIQIDSPNPTGLVDVLVEEGMPTYEIKEGAAWDSIEMNDTQLAGLEETQWDLMYCGTLAQRTSSNRILLSNLLAKLNYRHLFFDVNLRQDYYSPEVLKSTLAHTTILKLNEEELPVVAELVFGEDMQGQDFFERAAEEYGLELLVLTLGGEGAQIFHEDLTEGPIHIPSVKVKVNDTVGAGDSFSGTFLYRLLSGDDLETAGKKAAALAGYVVRHAGALPVYDEDIKARLGF